MGGSSTIKKPKYKYIIPKAPAKEKECVVESNGGAKKYINTSMLEETGGGSLPDLEIPVTTT
jgi:hypothetical protein